MPNGHSKLIQRFSSIVAFLIVCILTALTVGCTMRVDRRVLNPEQVSTLDRRSPYLKAHLKNGNVAVISQWLVDEPTRLIRGEGSLLSVNRDTLNRGHLEIPIDSVALFETNVLRPSKAIASMAVMTGVSAALTILCVSSPKTCFGSCPTFYYAGGHDTTLVAEGFSSSVAPSLERADIDALYSVHPETDTLTLHLTNEALETHVIRYSVLLAAPKIGHAGVVRDKQNNFWSVDAYLRPETCSDQSGSCLDLVSTLDHRERFSEADSTDLATKEYITATFVAFGHNPAGLVIGFRQTLLSTYLFYQSLAYLGTRASEFLSQLERGSILTRKAAGGPGTILGGMIVEQLDRNGAWRVVDSVMETGPLASDLVVVPLADEHGDTVQCRVRLNKGHWRIDYLALVELGQQITPIRIEPTQVKSQGILDSLALSRLSSDTAALVAMPGDQFDISWKLPADPAKYEYFLESRGYYLEWMREEWLAEENAGNAAQILLDPKAFLRRVAPEYKHTERDMEQYFWGSKYAH